MATNEVFKHGSWLSLPLPLRGDDPTTNDDPTRNGDPVLIGDLVGFAQEVGGVPMIWPAENDPNASKSTVTFALSRNPANSLEPGWASVALAGAFAYPVDGWDPLAMGAGTPVGITAATPAAGGDPAAKARLVANSPEDHWFGVIVGQTKLTYPVGWADENGDPITVPEGTYVPIVSVIQTLEGRANAVADKQPSGS